MVYILTVQCRTLQYTSHVVMVISTLTVTYQCGMYTMLLQCSFITLLSMIITLYAHAHGIKRLFCKSFCLSARKSPLWEIQALASYTSDFLTAYQLSYHSLDQSATVPSQNNCVRLLATHTYYQFCLAQLIFVQMICFSVQLGHMIHRISWGWLCKASLQLCSSQSLIAIQQAMINSIAAGYDNTTAGTSQNLYYSGGGRGGQRGQSPPQLSTKRGRAPPKIYVCDVINIS